jgi:hypothetical protein
MAQLAERLHRKQQVVGLIPTLGSTHVLALVAERLKALDCKSGERKLHVRSNLTELLQSHSRCSSAWPERFVRDEEAARSNRAIETNTQGRLAQPGWSTRPIIERCWFESSSGYQRFSSGL